MRKLLSKFLYPVFLVAFAIPAFAQSDGGTAHTITGKVTDSQGEPLVGVVVMASQKEATITGANGIYSLKVVNPEAQPLQFSSLGYMPLSEQINGRTVVDVSLQMDATLLDDVVVVGYGVQKKVNVTGAVSSINFSKVSENRAIVSTSASLAGLAPGMSVEQASGDPRDNAATIRIRGEGSFTTSAAPLVLVDGIEWSMDNVNPNDIASISVLKDAASASIYGTRASNGVILITTKNGVQGKSQVNYSFKGIMQMPYNKLHFVSDYARHMELMNESCDNVGTSRQFALPNIDLWREKAADPYGTNANGTPNWILYPNTDWFDEIFQNGFSQEHDLSISGASKSVKYLISTGYLDNQGVMGRFGINSSTQRISFRTNLEADVTPWFTAGVRLFGQHQDLGLGNVANGFSSLSLTTPGVPVGTIGAWGRPTLSEESLNANNIFRMMYGSGGYNTMTRLNGSLYAKIRPYKGVSLEGTVNYSPTFGERHTYGREIITWDYTNDVMFSQSQLVDAGSNNTMTRSYNISSEILARYNNTFGEHEIGALAGYSAIEARDWGWGVQRNGATDWSLNDLGTYETLTNSSSTARRGWGLRSYFGRINYAWKERYLLEVNFRADGSSRFGSNNRYGYFPSFSAGWKIYEEEFMKGTENWLSSLKLRASWGEAGNNNIGNYAWQSTYAVQNMVLDGSPTKGLYIASLSNANLQWERTTTTNIGVDMGVLQNRLTAEIDWYNKKTDQILYTPPIYMTMGEVSGVPANLGALVNRGIELNVNWRSRIGKDFNYFAGVNFSYNYNKVTSFKGELIKQWNNGVYESNYANVTSGWGEGVLAEGYALGEYYLRRMYRGSGVGYTGGAVDIKAGPKDGMIRTQRDFDWVQAMIDSGYSFNGGTLLSKDQLWYGDLIYADRDGDGNYGDEDDMDFNGRNATPSYNLGLSLGFSWKGFDFSMLWSGAFDFYIIWRGGAYNGTTLNQGHGIADRVAKNHYFFDAANPSDERTNLTATYPRLSYGTALGNSLHSEFYEYKGDYLKMRNIQIGYTLPGHITKKIFAQQLRLFASGENLITLTKYPGLDPEKGNVIGYPLMRSVTFGAQITF